MKKILVTGAAGFIGSTLSEFLLKRNYKVIGLDNFDSFYKKEIKLQNLSIFESNSNFSFQEGDICEVQTFEKLPTDVDAVIHLAAKAGVLPSLENPAAYINTNILGTQNLLDWMNSYEIKNLVFGSSSSVYGNSKSIPFKEDFDVRNPISPYAATKVAGELLTHTFHHIYKFNVINLRFFTVIGERQRPDLAINKFVGMIMNDDPVTMYGDGSTARDYTYVGDIVEGIYAALNYLFEHSNTYETINLGNHTPVKLNDMIDTLYKLLNKHPNIQQLPMQPGDVNITYADISKAQALLNYSPKVSFEEGCKRFIDWFKNKNL